MRTDNFINYKISTNNIHIADSFQYTTKKRDERNNSVFEKIISRSYRIYKVYFIIS